MWLTFRDLRAAARLSALLVLVLAQLVVGLTVARPSYMEDVMERQAHPG